MKLYEKQIRKVLTLLEASVDSQINMDEIKSLAQKHVKNVNKINELQEQIDALLAQQQKFTDANEVIEEDIKNILANTQSQCLRFGKIIVDFQKNTVSGVTKSSPQYKAVVEDLKMTYAIEDRIINELVLKYNSGNKPFSRTDVSLSISKESIQKKNTQQLKEGLLSRIKSIYVGFKSVFAKLFKSFKFKLDDLEQRVAQL